MIAALVICSGLAHAGGSSIEDLAGAFSIEKTIKLGSSSSCFSSNDAMDPLTPPNQVGGAFADDQPPGLAGFSFEPKIVPKNTSSNIELNIHAIDDQGIWASEAVFSGPSGEEIRVLFPAKSIVVGSIRDGNWSKSAQFPAVNKTGEWTLERITIVDNEGNRRMFLQRDLAKLGLPRKINVV